VDGQLLSGRYQIVSYLGSGGFAQTYLAEDIQRPNRPKCVVKQLQLNSQNLDLLETARRLFRQEAEVLERLGTHPQIPQLLAYFEEQDEFFLVQEYIDGHSIAKEIEENCWQESKTIEFIEELLNIFIFVHSHNTIHRDIKPDNLIRRKRDGKLVLIDFGAVKEIYKQTETIVGNSKTTIGIGTIGYMPPEQITGKPRPCSDIYAIGITAIQALTGLSSQQLNYDDDGEVIWLTNAKVSQKLADFLSKMVSYYIKDRYQTAVEALTALQQLFPSSHSISSELNITKAIVPVNMINSNSPPLVNSTYRKKPAWLGLGLLGILVSGAIGINLKGWSDRSSIVVESKPIFSTQSTPTTTSEEDLVITPNTSIKPNSNNNTSKTIAPSIKDNRAASHNYDKQASSEKLSIKPQNKQVKTASSQKIEESRKTTPTTKKTEAPKKTTTTTNKTQSSNPTKSESQNTTRKKQPERTNQTKKKTKTATRNNRTQRKTKVTTRNNRTQGRSKPTKRKEKDD
jgi:serine/threonine protein kinase